MRTYYRCIVENDITEVGIVYNIEDDGKVIVINVGNGIYSYTNSTFLNDHFEAATCKDYIAQIHDRLIRTPFTFDYVETEGNKAYKTEKKQPRYLGWAELILEAYCN